MKPTELVAFLEALYRAREAQLLRHIAVSRQVGNLDLNNTYQYVVNREETHLEWLRDAIAELGGTVPPPGAEPTLEAGRGAEGASALIREDATSARAFVEQWEPRVGQVTNARHRTMLQLLVGEAKEHQRFFEQAAAGREDLLGRRMDAGARRGTVIASRWVGD